MTETPKIILEDVNKRMDGALTSIRHSFAGLRTGRASPAILDPIKVELYGDLMSISQLGSVSVPEARSLVVQVWDKDAVKAIEKAISNSGLGLNPSIDGQIIRIPIPDLSEERRKELNKKAGEYAEHTKVAVRNVRRDGIDDLKKLEKDKEISEDELKLHSNHIQKITDEHIRKIDDLLAHKSKEILTI